MKTVTKRGVIWPFFVRPLPLPLPLAKQPHNPPATTTRCNMKNNTLMELSHSYGGKHGQKARTRALRRMQRARVKSLRKTRTTLTDRVYVLSDEMYILYQLFDTHTRKHTMSCGGSTGGNWELWTETSVLSLFAIPLARPVVEFLSASGLLCRSRFRNRRNWGGGRNKRGTVCKRMSVWRRLWRYLTLLQLLLT